MSDRTQQAKGDRNPSNDCRVRSQFLQSARRLSDVWRQAAARLRISEKQVLLVSLHPLFPHLKLSLGMLTLGVLALLPSPLLLTLFSTPDILLTSFAGLLLHISLRIFKHGMVT